MDNFKPGDMAEVINHPFVLNRSIIGITLIIAGTPFVYPNGRVVEVSGAAPGKLIHVCCLKKINPPDFDISVETERELVRVE